jgi:hypothetical protein
MRLSLVFFSVALWMLDGANGADQKNSLAPCECDSPACPSQFLNKVSLCACLNQAALFCWKRNPQGLCPSPTPRACNEDGTFHPPSVTSAGTALPTSLFTPKYKGASGLNCVEIGYCYRPSRSMTTITVTLENGTTVITVPVGLPTQENLPTLSSTYEPIIVFTPEVRGRKAEEAMRTAVPKRRHI